MGARGRIKVRSVTPADCRLLWEWANDPEVRAGAFTPEPIPWEEHVAWFQRKTSDPRCAIYVFTDPSDRPMGQVRFDLQPDGSAEVTVSVDRAQRGRGYGTEGVRLACEQILGRAEVGRLVAYIKPHNVASVRMFEHAAFVHEGRTGVKGQEAIQMSRRRA